MKIEATPKEIADLVSEVQGRIKRRFVSEGSDWVRDFGGPGSAPFSPKSPRKEAQEDGPHAG